jgi:hypothetical protein
MFEMTNFRTDICSNYQFSNVQNFRMYKIFELSILEYKIFEQKLVVTGVILLSLDLTNLT